MQRSHHVLKLLPAITFAAWGCNPNPSEHGSNALVPRLTDVISIEENIVSNSCIGNPKDWRKNYFFPRSDPKGEFNTSTIYFLFKKYPNTIGRNMRTLSPPGGLLYPDDGDMLVAYGSYDIRTKTINVKFCGDNLP